MSDKELPEILDIEQAAELLGVSIKTFNKVLHTQDLPARKIGREWKFSRAALIAWVGSGKSGSFYKEGRGDGQADGHEQDNGDGDLSGDGRARSASPAQQKTRRTAGWRIEFD